MHTHGKGRSRGRPDCEVWKACVGVHAGLSEAWATTHALIVTRAAYDANTDTNITEHVCGSPRTQLARLDGA